MTNADRIRKMTDEEIADILELSGCENCPYLNNNCGARKCRKGFLKWLKQEVSMLDRLAAEYDRKHPNGLKFTYSLDGEVQQTEQEEKKNG